MSGATQTAAHADTARPSGWRWWPASRPRSSPDYQPTPPVRARYLAGLQKDVMVLLRYVASRPDRPLPMPGLRDTTAMTSVIFGTGPQAGTDAHIDQLQQMLDELSRLAAPATAVSIRLTEAYLHNPSIDGEPPEVVREQARSVRRTSVIPASGPSSYSF